MNDHPLTGGRRRQVHRKDPSISDYGNEIADDAIVGSPSDAEVVFIGPVGVGKTTAVQALSTVAPINTEVLMLEGAEAFLNTSKTTTTVGIDYGMWIRPDEKVIGLFGTTGQDRFTDSRTPLLNPNAGIVIWLFGDRGNLGADLGAWLSTAGGRSNSYRITIAVNFATPSSVDDITRILQRLHLEDIKVINADPRNKEDVAAVVTEAIKFTGV